MPTIKVIRKTIGSSIKIGGTFEVTGNINISSGLTIELNPSVFNSSGIWTLVTWTGALTGTASNITIVNNTGRTAGAVYLDGNSFKITLS
jgi:hypothetical protein